MKGEERRSAELTSRDFSGSLFTLDQGPVYFDHLLPGLLRVALASEGNRHVFGVCVGGAVRRMLFPWAEHV